MGDVVALTEAKNDCRLADPATILDNLARAMRDGTRKATSVLVILLDETDDNYDVGLENANMPAEKMFAVMEVVKVHALRTLGFIE